MKQSGIPDRPHEEALDIHCRSQNTQSQRIAAARVDTWSSLLTDNHWNVSNHIQLSVLRMGTRVRRSGRRKK